MAEANPDAAPQKDKKTGGIDDIEEPIQDWKFYFMPANMSKLMNRNMLLFSLIVGFYYCIQFVCCCGSTNAYSEEARLTNCTVDGTVYSGEAASAIMDKAILVSGIHHLIEWVRCTILLTIVCLNVNLMPVWYLSMINTILGFVAFIFCIMVYTSPAAQACGAQGQSNRYNWLLIEIIVTGVSALFFFPSGLIRLQAKEKVHYTLYKEDDDDDEDDDEEGEDED